jgi:hypothetical protein
VVCIGVHGGPDVESVHENDHYDPPRFFASYRDAFLIALVTAGLQLLQFRRFDYDGQARSDERHYQAVVLRKPGG